MESHLPADPLARAPRGAAASGDAFAPGRAARDAARHGLYVHVPFCRTRCTYCDFSSGEKSPAAVERWFAALEKEAPRRAAVAAGVRFGSLFFGGGTPSALAARDFARLRALLAAHFTLADGAEVTLEANPETVDDRRLETWAAAGVNRLSMGAQSFAPEELAVLGRIHDAARPPEAIARARAHGFTRVSLDLMFGFPGHRMETWRASVERALETGIEHLSAYCFIPEAGTPLGDAVLKGRVALPEPEAQADLYAWLGERLGAAGFANYETSNFCRPGAECRHNLVYWLRRPYVGLGPSAHGLWNGVRTANHYALGRWALDLEHGGSGESEREVECADSRARESVLLALRLGCGLEAHDFTEAAWGEIDARYGAALEAATRAGRLERTRDGWRVPPSLRFVADDAIAWVEARSRAADLTLGAPAA